MRQFKTHEERFSGFYIRPKLVDLDSEGYGRAECWLLSNTTGQVIFEARRLTDARVKALSLSRELKAKVKSPRKAKANA